MTSQAKVDYRLIDDAALARLCADRDADAVRHVLACNNQRLFRAA